MPIPAIDPSEQENVAAATNVLQTALRDILREELGQTYGVSVGLSQPLPQPGYGRVEVSYGSAPENIDAMTERVMKEIKRLQDEGPSADLTMRAKEGAKRAYETNLKQNAYWLRRLATVHMLGQDPGRDSPPPGADRRRHAGAAPRRVPALFPDGSLYGGDDGAGAEPA